MRGQQQKMRCARHAARDNQTRLNGSTAPHHIEAADAARRVPRAARLAASRGGTAGLRSGAEADEEHSPQAAGAPPKTARIARFERSAQRKQPARRRCDATRLELAASSASAPERPTTSHAPCGLDVEKPRRAHQCCRKRLNSERPTGRASRRANASGSGGAALTMLKKRPRRQSRSRYGPLSVPRSVRYCIKRRRTEVSPESGA